MSTSAKLGEAKNNTKNNTISFFIVYSLLYKHHFYKSNLDTFDTLLLKIQVYFLDLKGKSWKYPNVLLFHHYNSNIPLFSSEWYCLDISFTHNICRPLSDWSTPHNPLFLIHERINHYTLQEPILLHTNQDTSLFALNISTPWPFVIRF